MAIGSSSDRMTRDVAAINEAPEMVSVVIPTRDRPHLVLQAVRSALGQTYGPIEVIVVVDGPDEATESTLLEVGDPRVRVVTLPANAGPADARNAGVGEARGAWVAFLDDDDEWLPRKVEVQMDAAGRSSHAFPIVTSRIVAHTLKGEFIWPKRLMSASESLGEYLFLRKPFYGREGMISTPTLLVNKTLLNEVPFRSGSWIHEDWEWLLRVSTLEGVGVEFVPDALVIVRMQENRVSLANRKDWQRSLAWIQENRDLVTPRAYAGFILTQVSRVATREGDRKASWHLLWEAVCFGKPRAVDLLLYTTMWLIPRQVRHRLVAFASGDRRT